VYLLFGGENDGKANARGAWVYRGSLFVGDSSLLAVKNIK